MKNLKNWLNKNNFSFEVKNNMVGEEMVFINIQDLGNENSKRVKTYLKRYKFNFEYRCNYTYIVAKKEDVKTCEVIDNSIAESEIKENKTNDLTQQANDLIESLPVKKGSKAIEYINYLKNNNIDSKDSKNKFVLAARVHLVRYGSFASDAIAKAAEIEKVSSTKDLELKYFNKLLDLLKEQKEIKEIKEERTLLKMNLQTLAADPQIEKWNNKINSEKEVNRHLNTLKRVINKRKKESPYLELIPCNGYIISKILQYQGNDIQFSRPEYTKCYYDLKRSTEKEVKIVFKDCNNNLSYYTIYTDLKENKEIEETEQIKNNKDGNIEEIKTLLKMSSETSATNKNKLKPIFNDNIEGHEEYQKEQLKIYTSGKLNFTHKRINNKMIEEYTKYFIYKDNTFMSVKPSIIGYVGGYYDHVKKYNYKVDHVNKVILFTDAEGII